MNDEDEKIEEQRNPYNLPTARDLDDNDPTITDDEQQAEFEKAQAEAAEQAQAIDSGFASGSDEDEDEDESNNDEEEPEKPVENPQNGEADKAEENSSESSEASSEAKEETKSEEKENNASESQNKEGIEIPGKITGSMLYIGIAKIAKQLEQQQEELEKIKQEIAARENAEQSLLDKHEKQLKEIEKALLIKAENAMYVMDQAEIEMRQVQRRNVMLSNFYPSWQPYHEDIQEYITKATEYISAQAKHQSQIYVDNVQKNSEIYFETIVKEHKNALEALGQRYAEEIKKFQGISVKLPKITIEQMIIPTGVSFVGMIIVMMLTKLM